MPQPKTSAERAKAKEREVTCLEARIARKTYRTIAKEQGMSVGGVYDAVSRALANLAKESTEKAEEVRQIELSNLDRMEERLLSRVDECDLAAFDRVLRVQERRAKLLGLDAPTKQVVATMTHEEMLAQLDDPDDEPNR